MTHFTLTGYYAGMAICGKERTVDDTDKYLHYGSLYGRPEPEDICAECHKIESDLLDRK